MYISKQDLEKLGIKNVTPVKVPETKHDSLQMQRNLEINMMVKGVQRQRKAITKAKSRKKDKDNKPRETTESVTIYGQQLVQEGLLPMTTAINKYYISAVNGEARKLATEVILLTKCLPIQELEKDSPERWDAIAFITLKSVLDSITVGSTQNKAVFKIANAIEDEARLAYFKDTDKKTYQRTKEWLNQNKKRNYSHNRRVFRHAMNRHNLEWQGFTNEEKVKLGKLLLELLIIHTGLVEFSNKVIKNKVYKYIKVTPKTLSWIDKKKISSEVLKPCKLPMIVEPQDWTTPYNGGYYIKQLRPPELMKALEDKPNANKGGK